MPYNSFPKFLQLPIELRYQIWDWAVPRRSRLIQVFYDSEKKTWLACKDGCGGLPEFLPNKEAYKIAMKHYTPAFGTYVDFSEDVIFVSDPMFTIRQPQNAFLDMECANKICKIAFTNEICQGLVESEELYSKLCLSIATILQKIQNVVHFMVAMSDDEAEFYLDFPEEFPGDDEDEGYEGYEEREEDQAEDHDNTGEQDQNEALDPEAVSMAGGEATPEEEQITEQELQDLEEEAIATMSKGYFRQVGDIRFESAADDSVYVYDLMTHFLDAFSSKKKQQPDWVRPKISIMAVKYGLRPVRDFNYQIHYLGDHKLKAGESYAPANYYADLVTVYSSENEAEEPLEDDLSTGAN